MAGIGKQNGKVELYVVHDLHIRSMDSSLDYLTIESESENKNEDLFYVDIIFDDILGVEKFSVDVSKEIN